MIFDAMCTRGDCVLSEMERSVGKALCPCCGTRYDLAGRVLAGPAPHNLPVPPHRFVDETTIEFTVADVMATLA
jgi:ubiquinol-cytochrome c reductase iron-sulfur subunit